MPTIGEKLRAAREARNLSIPQVVQATRIRSYYIEAMEADDLSTMPSAVQARGFLRAYAEFLKLDWESIANPQAAPVIEAESTGSPEPEPAPEAAPQPEEETPAPVQEETPQADEPSPVVSPSSVIFRQIGLTIRERRELLGLTLDEIERHTRVRRANLQLIEQGDFDNLPSPVQARGMLSTYANFLDMNSEAMLLRFADGLQARRAERQRESAPQRQRWTPPIWLRQIISPDLFFGVLVVISITGLILWGASRLIALQELEESSEAPSISDVLLANPEAMTETPEPLPTSIEELGTPLPALIEEISPTPQADSPLPGSILQVTLLIRERVFLRVIVDGEVQQNGRIASGSALTFDGQERIEVLTGNGNAVQVIYNQFDFGVLGNPGEVVNRIYTLDGIQTPTPTASPTPTNTPRFQPSPTPTVTSTPEITELP